ncbi:MAG: fatty acid desaturase family protein [Alphaproteobacteria bacterium]|nr:fatty acid desaturase family protein [Alphaproteobacteria bacterium]
MSDNLSKRYTNRLKAKELKRLSRRNPYYWLKDTMIDWLVIGTAFAVFTYNQNPITFILAILVIGNRQHALGLLGHDGTHYTLSYNRKLNDLITNVFAWWPIGLTMSGYRNLHNMHHKFVGTPNDPEVIYKGLKAEQWHLPTKIKDVLRLAAKDLIGFGANDYFTILTYAKPTNKSSFFPLAVFHFTFITASLYAGIWQIPTVWYASMLTAFPMYFRLRLWLEHQGTDFVHRLHLNKLEGALLAPHLAWYHWEHHACPTVPYCKLPEVRALMPTEPVITLKELIYEFENSEFIHAGAIFKDTQTAITISEPVNSDIKEGVHIKAA